MKNLRTKQNHSGKKKALRIKRHVGNQQSQTQFDE